MNILRKYIGDICIRSSPALGSVRAEFETFWVVIGFKRGGGAGQCDRPKNYVYFDEVRKEKRKQYTFD